VDHWEDGGGKVVVLVRDRDRESERQRDGERQRNSERNSKDERGKDADKGAEVLKEKVRWEVRRVKQAI